MVIMIQILNSAVISSFFFQCSTHTYLPRLLDHYQTSRYLVIYRVLFFFVQIHRNKKILYGYFIYCHNYLLFE